MHILLETERLRLRRFMESDVENLFELDNDRDVMRYINGGTPTAIDVIRDEILPGFLEYDDGLLAYGFWAVIGRQEGDFLGWVSLRPLEGTLREASLGYRLHKAAWGKGYATEAARALLDQGFGEMGLERVSATTYEKNVASCRVMEKLGMKLVRRFRITTDDLLSADTYHSSSLDVWDGDDLEYAVDRADWAREQ